MDIKELAKKYNLHQDDFWELSQRKGTWIIKHDACEKIAAIEKITFAKPDVHYGLDAICLIGEASKSHLIKTATGLKEETETLWATGEASAVNVMGQGKYYWAMAEKRLKDRLILKLIHAYEFGIYSEEEADSFKKVEEPAYVHANGVASYPNKKLAGMDNGQIIIEEIKTALNARTTVNSSKIQDLIDGVERTNNLTQEQKDEWMPQLQKKYDNLKELEDIDTKI